MTKTVHKLLTEDMVKEAFTTNLVENVNKSFQQLKLNQQIKQTYLIEIAEVNKEMSIEIKEEIKFFVEMINNVLKDNGTVDLSIYDAKDIRNALGLNNVSVIINQPNHLLNVNGSFNAKNFDPIIFINLIAGFNICFKSLIDFKEKQISDKHMLDFNIKICREKGVSSEFWFKEGYASSIKNAAQLEEIINKKFTLEKLYKNKINNIFVKIEKEQDNYPIEINRNFINQENFVFSSRIDIRMIMVFSTIEFLKNYNGEKEINEANQHVMFKYMFSLLNLVGDYFDERKNKSSIFDDSLSAEEIESLSSIKKNLLGESWIKNCFNLLNDYAMTHPENVISASSVERNDVLKHIASDNILKKSLKELDEFLFLGLKKQSPTWFERFQKQVDECYRTKRPLQFLCAENPMSFNIWLKNKREEASNKPLLSYFKVQKCLKLQINIYDLESLGKENFRNIQDEITTIMQYFPEDFKKDFSVRYSKENESLWIEINEQKYGDYVTDVIETFIETYSDLVKEKEYSDMDSTEFYKTYNERFASELREKILMYQIGQSSLSKTVEEKINKKIERKKI